MNPPRLAIDLNADVGEGIGDDERLIPLVTSASIACGGHAGDAATMARAVDLAIGSGVAVGAHPGLEDRENFGRIERALPAAEAAALVKRQVEALKRVTDRRGIAIEHVKLHGALYHMAARDRELAKAIAEAVLELDRKLIVFGPPGAALIAAAQARGLAVAREIFADRRYRSDGTLVPRTEPAALIETREEAVAQVLGFVLNGRAPAADGAGIAVQADTVCLHGDAAHAVDFARQLRPALRENGIEIRHVRARFGGF